jgi:DNA-binding MarR family transcriptional regulator
VTPSQIARTLAMSAPNLTQLLDRLAERGLVARERNPHDRRAQHIRLTRSGRALARKAHEISLGMEQTALQHLSDAERAMLLELLQRVARPGRS